VGKVLASNSGVGCLGGGTIRVVSLRGVSAEE